MNPDEVFSSFISKWQADFQPPGVVTAHDLEEVESKLSLELPPAYTDFVSRYGIPYTPDILDRIVETEADLFDLNNFEHPSKILDTTANYEKAGMPRGFVVFAGDSMGNVFLFKIADCREKVEIPVWVFDHDFATIEEVGSSFVNWLNRYVAI